MMSCSDSPTPARNGRGETRPRVPALLTAILAVLLLAGPVAGQVTVWREHWDAGLDYRDEVLAMALTPEEDIIAVGFTVLQYPMSRVAIGIVRFAAGDGEIAWAKTWQATAASADYPTGVAVDDSGNIFISGYSHTRSADSTDWLVLKYLPDGTEAWQVRHHHLLVDVAAAVVPDGAGGCYVAGHSTNAAGKLDLAVAHYDADGNQGWLTMLGGAANGNDAARALAYDGDGGLYAAGYTWTGPTDSSAYWLVKLDAGTGDTAWTRTYSGSAGSGDPRDDRAGALALGPDGTVYVTGRAGEQGTWYDATTVCWNRDGDRLWVNRFDAAMTEDGATEIAVDAAGNAYVGGYTFDYYFESEMDMLVHKIRPDGNTDWFRVHDSGFNEDDSCTAVMLDEYGNVYVAGIVSDNVGCLDWAVMKYSPAGERRWLHLSGVYDEDDYLFALLVDSRGHVYAGGTDYYLGDDDFAVLKLGQQDVGVTAVLEPADTLRLWAETRPRVRVHNHSPVPQSFPVWLYIGNFYFDARHVADLAPYDSADVEFNPWLVRDVGEHTVVAFTALAGDHEPANDTARAVVTTVPAWELLAPLPPTPGRRSREVRDGGALACSGDSLVYAFKGNNTTEFYVYEVGRDSWRQLDSVPRESPNGRRKRVKRGAKLAAGPGRVYALKGNNTLDFMYYPVGGDSGWQWLAPYPTGAGRRVRGGGGLDYVPTMNRLYSAKGSNTLEFFAYDIAGDSWLQLADVHPGPRNRRVKYGSAMTWD
ncbi:MAG TPA: hypothetical protein ENN51_00050, partial [candidate division WOR-3 bacterium]|nr:hypothetical protein [candidate division WOR-3 bacterium]